MPMARKQSADLRPVTACQGNHQETNEGLTCN